jgi:hypothetical protein
MSELALADDHERLGFAQYLERLAVLDNRAAVRLQAAGPALGVWSGPPFEVVAVKPVALARPETLDVTVSALRLLEAMGDDLGFVVPPSVTGPMWVGLLPPRSGWEERGRTSVGNVRAAVDSAKQFFVRRTEGVTDRAVLEGIANDVWERACVAEVPTRSAHAAEALGLLGPADGEAIAFATDAWTRLTVPGGSVAARRGLLPSLSALSFTPL